MTEEQVIEKEFEQFYKSTPKNSPPKKFFTEKDNKPIFNQITSRESDGESQEVILSPNNLPIPVENSTS